MAATYSPTTCSTIGVAELNDPVRNGKGWDLSAITTLMFHVGNVARILRIFRIFRILRNLRKLRRLRKQRLPTRG